MNNSNSIDITPTDGYPHMYDFINNSHVKCFFVVNCIQNYIYPK